MTIMCPRKVIGFCKAEVRRAAEGMANKGHFLYLAAATILDTSIIIRITTGSCLVCCLVVEFLKEEEAK